MFPAKKISGFWQKELVRRNCEFRNINSGLTFCLPIAKQWCSCQGSEGTFTGFLSVNISSRIRHSIP